MKPTEKHHEAFWKGLRDGVWGDKYFIEEALTDLPSAAINAIHACVNSKDDASLGALIRHYIDLHVDRETDKVYEEEVGDFEANFAADMKEITR